MAIASDIFGLNRQSITESFDGYETINLEQELADVEPLEEGVDPLDYMLGVAYECEIDMQRIEMDIIGEEYSYLRENGTEMVYESSKANTIIDKFKAWIDKLWTKIQAFFKSVLAKFSDKWLSDEKFAAKYGAKAEANVVSGKKIAVSVVETDKLDSVKTYVLSALKNAEKTINAINEKVMKDADDYKDGVKLVKDTFFTNIQINSEDIDTEVSIAKIARAAKVDIAGAKVKHFANHTEVTNAKTYLSSQSKTSRKEISEQYEANKKMIAAAKKSAKKMESAVKRFKVLPTEESKQIHYRVKLINKVGTLNSKFNRIGVQVLNMKSNACRTILVAAARGGAVDDSDPQNAQSAGSK